MKYLFCAGGGLGDIMAHSLQKDYIGKLHSLLYEKNEIDVLLMSNNIYDIQWFEWIDGLSFWRGNPKDMVDNFGGDIFKYIAARFPQFNKSKILLDLNNIPMKFEFPYNENLKKYKVIVQAFAGTNNRSVFTENMIKSLDKEEVAFIGKNNNRVYVLTDPPTLRFKDRGHPINESLPQLKYADNLLDKLDVMETFQLIRNCEWFVGTFSSFMHPAWFYNKKTICVTPKILVEDECYVHSGHAAHLSTLAHKLDYKRILSSDNLTDEEFTKIVSKDIFNEWNHYNK